MSRRHAVLCKPRREAVAEANLRNQGFDVYLPRRFGLRRRAGQREQTPVGADAGGSGRARGRAPRTARLDSPGHPTRFRATPFPG